jgi:hypothetical protein
MVALLFELRENVMIKFDQNHYQIHLFQNYFANNHHPLINPQDYQKNFALNFAKMDLLPLIFYDSLNNSF